jgi:hypothetical protein
VDLMFSLGIFIARAVKFERTTAQKSVVPCDSLAQG